MALMFRSSWKTSCLCGLATLRRHTTSRWSEESAWATKQERTSCSLSLYSTQSMMCPQRWVGFQTPWTMSNVVMICRALEVSGLEGESKCMLKSPSMISFPRSVATLPKIQKLGKKDSISELVFPTRRGSVKAEEVNMMGGSELKLHEFKGGVGEGEGGVDGDRKVVSVDHGQSTTTHGMWKGPQLVARRSQVDTLTLVAMSFHSCLCQKQYVNTFIFHECHNFFTFLFGPNWLGVEDRSSESFVVLTGVDTNQITLFLVMGVGRRKRLSVDDCSCGGVWVRTVVLEVRLGRNGVERWWMDRSITAIDPHTDLPRLIPATPPRSLRFPWLIAGKAQVSEMRDQQGRERTSRGRGGSSNIQKILPSVSPVTGGRGSVGVGGGRSGIRSTDTELNIGWTVGLNTWSEGLTAGKQYNTDSRAKACRNSTRPTVLISSGSVAHKWYQNDGHIMTKDCSTSDHQMKNTHLEKSIKNCRGCATTPIRAHEHNSLFFKLRKRNV